MSTEHDLPPLPEPDTCLDDDPPRYRHVWFEETLRSYATLAVEQERKLWAARFKATEKTLASLAAIKARREGRTAWLLLNDMTPDQRMEVFRKFCRHCGGEGSGCKCWNDE